MRADCFHEPQRLPGDLSVEMQTAFVSVLEVFQMPLNGDIYQRAFLYVTAVDCQRDILFLTAVERPINLAVRK